MYGITQQSGSHVVALIDDRNERPLTIALAAIVVVWSMAFALTFASAHFSPYSAHWSESPAAAATAQ
jgi:hypothetical protein